MQNKGECFFFKWSIYTSKCNFKNPYLVTFLGGSKKDYCSCIVHFGPFFGREDCLRQNYNIWDSRRNHLFYNICKKTGEIVVAALRRGEKFEEDMGWRWWKNKKSRFENVHPFLPNFFIIVKHANFKVKTSSLTTKKNFFLCVCMSSR